MPSETETRQRTARIDGVSGKGGEICAGRLVGRGPLKTASCWRSYRLIAGNPLDATGFREFRAVPRSGSRYKWSQHGRWEFYHKLQLPMVCAPCFADTRSLVLFASGRARVTNDQKFKLLTQVTEAAVTAFRTVVIVVGAVILGFYAREVLIAFAGHQTGANVSLSLIAKLEADRWFAYLVGATGAGYGYVQRGLRQRTIKRLTERTSELETRIDKRRSSSGLTPKGRTRREDR